MIIWFLINPGIYAREKYQTKLDNFFGIDKSYDILEDYVNENTAIKHRCRICKYEWTTSPANITGGMYGKTRVCPSCNKMIRTDFNKLSKSYILGYSQGKKDLPRWKTFLEIE